MYLTQFENFQYLGRWYLWKILRKAKDMMDILLGIVNIGVTVISIIVTIVGIILATKKKK